MICRRFSILILAVLATSSFLRAQDKSTAAPSQSIYRNCVGSWEGASVWIENGNLQRGLVKIVIAEEPKKNRMRLDYVYINDQGTQKNVRFIQLDPVRESMKMHSKGDTTDRFEVKGLEQFAQTGLGDFTAFHCLDPGSKRMERMMLHLEAAQFHFEAA